MDKHEGMQPESIKPLPGSSPAVPGHPADAFLPPGTALPAVEEENDLEEEGRFLTPGNLIMLSLLCVLMVFLLYKFTGPQLWNIVKAALGLSFVIFVHELGHFVAAKWCDVHVTTFSIGFGPAIPGCRFRWGETTYKLAILPLGGYVQMVGQVDGDEASDGDDDPRSYRKKTVAQRMLIISAGVIMNAILAVVCFIAIYLGSGKEHNAAVISYVDSYAPSYRHGLRTSAVITQIGSVVNPTFTELTQTVINSRGGDPIPVKYQRPGEPEFTAKLEPRLDKTDTKPVIGVAPPSALKLIGKRDAQQGPYVADTPAEAAKFEFGDVIIATTDPDDPRQAKDYRTDRLKELPDDPRLPGHGQRDYFEFARRMQLLADREIMIRVQRKPESGEKSKEESIEVNLTVAPLYKFDLGVRMQMGPILVIREHSPAADAEVQAPKDKLEGDLIELVSVIDADGKTLEFSAKAKTLDPERLPLQLRQWSDRLDQAKLNDSRMVTLYLRRHRDQAGAQFEQVKKELKWDPSWRFDRVVPISPNAPMAVPELGIAYQIKTTVASVTDQDSPLKVGDEIKNFRYDYESFREENTVLRALLITLHLLKQDEESTHEDVHVPWMREELESGQWANVSFEVFQQPVKFKKLFFKVLRDRNLVEVEIPVQADKTWPLADRGWRFTRDVRRVKASGPLQAISMGFSDTLNRMLEVFQNLRGMFSGRIAFKNLGGPLTIAAATYQFAGRDLTDFAWFLGLISINLAVVNFLPVPVLDGGHMVFLIYEKIRGQSASEPVRVGATYVGLLMIASLMFFVLYLDVLRIFF